MIKTNRQRSPERNPLFNKVRFVWFFPLSPPSWEIVFNQLIPKMRMWWVRIMYKHTAPRCCIHDTKEELPPWKNALTGVRMTLRNLRNLRGRHSVKVRFLPPQLPFPLVLSVNVWRVSAYRECALQVNIFLICRTLKENALACFFL